jgi:chaperonin cofactor prefoldin
VLEGILAEDREFYEKVTAIVNRIIDQRLGTERLSAITRPDEELRPRDLSLLERMIRVEEELKALREIQTAQLQSFEKRFEAIDKRFEAMDKRFEALQREMNARFEALEREMNARFETMDKRFEALQREMNARFEAVDKRFEALQREMNARFEAVDKRFEAMDKRFATLQWTMGVGFSVVVALIGFLKFWQ